MPTIRSKPSGHFGLSILKGISWVTSASQRLLYELLDFELTTRNR